MNVTNYREIKRKRKKFLTFYSTFVGCRESESSYKKKIKMKVKVVHSVSHFLRNLLGNNFTICILMMCICLSLQYNMNMLK